MRQWIKKEIELKEIENRIRITRDKEKRKEGNRDQEKQRNKDTRE